VHETTTLTLTDSGLETELLFLDGMDLPDFASFPLLAHETGRDRLARYYRDHVALAEEFGVPVVLETPTWRASSDWGTRLGVDDAGLAELNAAAVALLDRVRSESAASVPVTVSGNLGPRGDGYDAGVRMGVDEAEAYHRPQVEALVAAGADQVCALTMTYVEEAVGIVRAARAAGAPVVISFTVEVDGLLPSGDTLGAALAAVEAATEAYATHYGLNCAHPDHVEAALEDAGPLVERVRLFRANASRLSHAELDAATELDDGDPVELGAQLADLHRRYPHLSVLGGCCGTDRRHVAAIAAAAVSVTV
jgi:S-methylmethionine-dependent homocysteine/selenocysteine methylase